MTTSDPDISSIAFCGVNFCLKIFIFTVESIVLILSAAESTFFTPTSFSECRICLCKFEISTSSSSIILISPIPAATKYKSAGLPRPPAPITETIDFENLTWPDKPIWSSTICLSNRFSRSPSMESKPGGMDSNDANCEAQSPPDDGHFS